MEPVRVVDANEQHDYGEPGPVERLRTRFDGFAALPHAVGDYTFGPEAELHGHTWKLYIHPGRYNEEDEDYVRIGLNLSLIHI